MKNEMTIVQKIAKYESLECRREYSRAARIDANREFNILLEARIFELSVLHNVMQ